MNKQLKPCPFCGGAARLQHDTSSDHSFQWNYLVICTNLDDCWICGKTFSTPEAAADWWNRRIQTSIDELESAWERFETVGEILEYLNEVN